MFLVLAGCGPVSVIFAGSAAVIGIGALVASYNPSEHLGKPTNPDPPHKSENIGIKQTLSWNPVKGAQGYYIHFSEAKGLDEEGQPPYKAQNDNASHVTYDPGELTFSNVYYWRVIAYNSKGNSSGPVWKFTTDSANVWPFAIFSTAPCNNAVDVDIFTHIEAVFTDVVDTSSVSIDNVTSDTFFVTLENSSEKLAGKFRFYPEIENENSVVFDLDNDMEYGTSYKLNLTTGIKSASSSSGAHLFYDEEIAFETQNTPTKLDIIDYFPEDEAFEVPITTQIWVKFSALVLEESLNATNAEGFPSFYVIPGRMNDNSDEVLKGNVWFQNDNRTAIFEPDSSLLANQDYTITVRSGGDGVKGAINDILLEKDFTSHFSTRLSPLIKTHWPGTRSSKYNVNVVSPITVDFHESMDADTIGNSTFILTCLDRFDRVAKVPGTVDYDNSIFRATFTSAEPRSYGTLYTVTLDCCIANTDGTLDLDNDESRTFSFTTIIAPVVTSVQVLNKYVITDLPADNETVPVNSHLVVVFNQRVNSSSISTDTVILEDNATGTPVPWDFSYPDLYTLEFTNTDDVLAFDTVYKFVLVGGNSGILFPNLNFLPENMTYYFTTDTATHVDLAPLDNDVGLTSAIAAYFSRSLMSETVTGSNFYVVPSMIGGFAISSDERSIVLIPGPPMAPGTDHTIYLDTTIIDERGNPLPDIITGEFTTGSDLDNVSPICISRTPLGTGVPGNTAVTITFNCNIIPQTFSASSPALLSDTILLNSGAGLVTGKTSFELDNVNFRTKAIFTPDDSLIGGETYTVTVTSGVCDLSYKEFADNTWTFEVEGTRPTLDSHYPVDTAPGVKADVVIKLNFDEDMHPGTINSGTFFLKTGTKTVDGVISVLGNTATLTPVHCLNGGSIYNVTVLESVSDLAYNGITDGEVTFSFTVESTPPTKDTIEPSDGSAGIAVTENIVITMTEDIDPDTVIFSKVGKPGTVRVEAGGKDVYGDITVSGAVITFDPAEDLAPDTTFTIIVTVDVTDLGGTPLAAEFTSTFSTAAP
jgi:hypothetical protein